MPDTQFWHHHGTSPSTWPPHTLTCAYVGKGEWERVWWDSGWSFICHEFIQIQSGTPYLLTSSNLSSRYIHVYMSGGCTFFGAVRFASWIIILTFYLCQCNDIPDIVHVYIQCTCASAFTVGNFFEVSVSESECPNNVGKTNSVEVVIGMWGFWINECQINEVWLYLHNCSVFWSTGTSRTDLHIHFLTLHSHVCQCIIMFTCTVYFIKKFTRPASSTGYPFTFYGPWTEGERLFPF